MENRELYEQFIEWLRSCGAYVPNSGELMPLIRTCYRPEEARLLTGMPLTLTDLGDLAALKGLEARDLAPVLDDLAERGLVFRSEEGGGIQYRLNSLRFAFLRSFFWPGRKDEYTAAVACRVSRYYRDGFGDHWKDVQTKGLRVVPIQRTLDDRRRILPYEDVLNLLLQQERFAVAHCACRHRANMDPSATPCKHETETCLHFGRLADYIVKNSLGREITREESEEILARSAEAGLVHAVSNWQRDVDTICNCCMCCCVYFQAFHVLRHGSAMNASAYEVHTRPESCRGCGVCVKRCPMGALRLEAHPLAENTRGKASVPDRDLCIGCGVCAHGCPTQSLSLKRRPTVIAPPQDVNELKRKYAEELARARSGGRKTLSVGSPPADVSS